MESRAQNPALAIVRIDRFLCGKTLMKKVWIKSAQETQSNLEDMVLETVRVTR
jgi:hypothetical protein